jgi:hypothetical protein
MYLYFTSVDLMVWAESWINGVYSEVSCSGKITNAKNKGKDCTL